MKIQGENSTAVPLAPEAVAEAAGWIISHYESFWIWTCIRKNRAQLFDDHSEIEQESFWPAKVKSLWDLEVLKNRHPTRIQFVASRRRGRTAAGGNGRKNRRGMTFEPILVGYVGTCLFERHVQLKRRRRPSAHFCSYWSRMQTLAWSDVLRVFSGDRTFTIMATSIWNGYVSIWGLCLCTLYSKRYRLSSFDPSIYLATHHSLFVPGISAFHIKRQQFLAERTLPVRKMTPLLPQVLPPTSLGQPSSCEKGGVRLLRKERQLQRSGGRKGLSYQACNQGESFHP